MHYYTRAHLLHDINTFRKRTRTCKYRRKFVTAERDLNILQFESPLSTSERLPKLIKGSKYVYMFEMIFKQTMSLTRHSCLGKHGRLGNQIGTREMSRGRSLRSIHFIWFLTTWVTVGNSSKCVFVLISMLGRVKNSHYSS